MYPSDGLNQLASFDRGTLNAGRTAVAGTPARTQDWDYDAAGNWDGVTTDGTAEPRTHDRQNRVAVVGSLTWPTYDANGNLTGDTAGRQFEYDAWDRLVRVRTGSGSPGTWYRYDGRGYRVSASNGYAGSDLYYSADWRVVEERVWTDTLERYDRQYVWSAVYVDALVLRDRDTDDNGSLDERLWAVQDGNWNVTALVDGAGAVVERYAYDPFGTVTVLTPGYGGRTGSSYEWVVGFQGLRFDGTAGLSEARFRWYSPTLGRWATTDPIRFRGGDVNLYGFVANGPTGKVDPSGLQNPASGRGGMPTTGRPGGGGHGANGGIAGPGLPVGPAGPGVVPTGGWGGMSLDRYRPVPPSADSDVPGRASRPSDSYFNPFKAILVAILAPDLIFKEGSWYGGLSTAGQTPTPNIPYDPKAPTGWTDGPCRSVPIPVVESLFPVTVLVRALLRGVGKLHPVAPATPKPGIGGNGAASQLPNLSGKSSVDAVKALEGGGFKPTKPTPSPGGWQTFKHPDGSQVDIHFPSGRVVRQPPIKLGSDGRPTNKGQRLGPDGAEIPRNLPHGQHPPETLGGN